MARLMRLSDSLRCLLGGTVQGPNHAFSCEGLAGRRDVLPLPLSLVQETLEGDSRRFSVVDWQGTFRYALASARARSSPRVWELHRLHVGGGMPPSELLEVATATAASLSGERVFLRVAAEDPLLATIRAGDFQPCLSEVRLVGRATGAQPASTNGKPVFRRREARDEQGIFQLYCAATPAPVRSALGMALEQWKDAREPCRGHREEWVSERNGKVCAWALVESLGQGFEARAMVHPDCPDLLAPTIDRAMCRGAQYTWLAPEYQEPLIRQLLSRSFQEAGRYTLLLKATAARVKEPALKPAEA